MIFFVIKQNEKVLVTGFYFSSSVEQHGKQLFFAPCNEWCVCFTQK